MEGSIFFLFCSNCQQFLRNQTEERSVFMGITINALQNFLHFSLATLAVHGNFQNPCLKNREKEHKKSKTVGKREEKKEVGLGANVQTWKLIPYISGVAQRVLQLQLLLLLLLKPWGRERERERERLS